MAQKTVLGKGLASLLPQEKPISVKEGTPVDRLPGVSLVRIDDIKINPYQPRRSFDESLIQSLAASIKVSGILSPLLVRKIPGQKGVELIAGERRLRAARLAGQASVPVLVKTVTDKESLEIALIENIQREDLSCVDEAIAYFQLIEDFGLTQEEVAKRVGKERATVANTLRLLQLSESLLADLRAERLSQGHAKVLLSVDDLEARTRLRNAILEEDFSVREAEKWAQKWKEGGAKAPSVKAAAGERRRFDELSLALSRFMGAKVELTGHEKRGKIVIRFRSPEELNRLLDALGHHPGGYNA